MSGDKKLTNIGGRLFYSIFLAGANRIFENQEELNRINVFPVPDGDTGNNLVATLRSVIDHAQPDESFHHTLHSIAMAALNGARGNSGVIFAQFLFGMSRETEGSGVLSIAKFTDAIGKSVAYIYEAVAEPVEGTMLTVIREWAEFIAGQKNKIDDFRNLFQDSYSIALQSLKETAARIKELTLTQVVDAGAKGFVLFLEGILEGLRKKFNGSEIIVKSALPPAISFREPEPIDVKHRYCTEALFKNNRIEKTELKSILQSFGDSVVIAGADSLARFHVHTDQPHLLFEKLRDRGSLLYQKVDDMKMQGETIRNRKYNIALVTDSTADLPPRFMDGYQIHMVPLNIHFGEEQYLDKLSLKPGQFFDLIRSRKAFPTTSQPNETLFHDLYSFLVRHYDSVISLHLSSKFSGTWQNSLNAAMKVSKTSGKKISVIDSRNVSGSLGLLTLRIAKAIESGESHEAIVSSVEKWIPKTRIFVSVRNLKYMIRGGRVSRTRGYLAGLMNVKPIVSMAEDGSSLLFDKAFSQSANMKRVMNHTRAFLKNQKLWNYIVLHAEGQDSASWYSHEMMTLTGKPPLDVINISPVIGLSAGKGTAAIAIMTE